MSAQIDQMWIRRDKITGVEKFLTEDQVRSTLTDYYNDIEEAMQSGGPLSTGYVDYLRIRKWNGR